MNANILTHLKCPLATMLIAGSVLFSPRVAAQTAPYICISTWPVARLKDGQPLSAAVLSEEMASVPGRFELLSVVNALIPSSFTVPMCFAPSDTASYSVVTGMASMVVSPGVLHLAELTAEKVYDGTTNATVQGTLTFMQADGRITRSWPTSYTTYRLQSQTNTLAVGLGTNWLDMPAQVGNTLIITPDPRQPTVFYRLSNNNS